MSAKAGKSSQTTPRRSVSPEDVPQDLSEQITEIREIMAFLVSTYKGVDDFKDLVGFLDKYSQASTRMAKLLKSQRELASEQDLVQALNQVLNEVLETLPGNRQAGR